MRLISYDLGQMGECKSPDGGRPSSLWSRFGIEYRRFRFADYPRHARDRRRSILDIYIDE